MDSIIELAQKLIMTPSQGGIDPCGHVLEVQSAWLDEHKVPHRVLTDLDREPIAIVIEIKGTNPGPSICLNACIDTAPIGDLESWELPPLSGALVGNWLWGRGSADSKTAVSIFSHLAIRFKERAREISGNLSFLFDGDEHTGQLGGIKAYMAENPILDGVAIGYPGNDCIVVGARGFYRAEVAVYGTAMHSGGRKPVEGNAIEKAAVLVQRLSNLSLPTEPDPDFCFGPKLTVTAINGGSGYSVVPDKCSVYVDIRLTPSFDREKAAEIVTEAVRRVDSEFKSSRPTNVREEESWPSYKLSENSLIVRSLRKAAKRQLGKNIPISVGGPSNIGNFLAARGIEATCGFGVTFKNLHAANECIDINSIEPVYWTYYKTIEDLIINK